MLSKETLQTALENVENHFSNNTSKMGATETARYRRVTTELKEELGLRDKVSDPTELPYGNSQTLNRND